MNRQIFLTKDKVATIDDFMFELINSYKWCAYQKGNTFYVMRNHWDKKNKHYRAIRMHRFIMEKYLNRKLL